MFADKMTKWSNGYRNKAGHTKKIVAFYADIVQSVDPVKPIDVKNKNRAGEASVSARGEKGCGSGLPERRKNMDTK